MRYLISLPSADSFPRGEALFDVLAVDFFQGRDAVNAVYGDVRVVGLFVAHQDVQRHVLAAFSAEQAVRRVVLAYKQFSVYYTALGNSRK